MKPTIPKVWLAIVRIRNWPNQIEADLARYYQLDVADWHQGRMSSRKLLVLLQHLPDESEYKTEFERDGQWPISMQMLKAVANETTLHRASLYAGGENAYSPQVFLDPHEQRERLEEAIAEEINKEATSSMYGSLGWS